MAIEGPFIVERYGTGRFLVFARPAQGFSAIIEGSRALEALRLFTAAPDMLALVEEELAELERASCVDLDDPDEPLSARASKLRAAIAKARGGK